MKCPHCTTAIHSHFTPSSIASYDKAIPQDKGAWTAYHQLCPECARVIIEFRLHAAGGLIMHSGLVHPKSGSRPVPPDVEAPYKGDFTEACNVLPHSAKASAALSRRILQTLLREKSATKSKDLADQIQEVIASGKMPSHINDGLHAVRHIGNFGVHPIKSTNTGEIVDVENGEAEWNLDTIEALFDFYFVEPAAAAKRKVELNKKLKDAGKPEIP